MHRAIFVGWRIGRSSPDAVAHSFISMPIMVPFNYLRGPATSSTRPAASKCGAHRTARDRDRSPSAPDWRWPRLRSDRLSSPDGLGMGHVVVTTVNRSTERSPSQGQGRQRGAPGRPRRPGATYRRISGADKAPVVDKTGTTRRSQRHYERRSPGFHRPSQGRHTGYPTTCVFARRVASMADGSSTADGTVPDRIGRPLGQYSNLFGATVQLVSRLPRSHRAPRQWDRLRCRRPHSRPSSARLRRTR